MAANAEIAGKGRGLIAQRLISAGEVVLVEQPVLLLPNEDKFSTVCFKCLRGITSGDSRAVAEPRATWAIQQLDRSGLTAEDATSLRLLIHLKASKAAGIHTGSEAVPSLWNVFCALSHNNQTVGHASNFHRRLSAATGDSEGMSAAEVEDLLRKEATNSYGIMAPSGPQGERHIRGSGIYPSASLLNHDCLPNLARFDDFDALAPKGTPGRVEISFRALHDIPAGEELTVSYFPLTLDYRERQERCQQLYGFECLCSRCQEERRWYEAEDEGMEDRPDHGTYVEPYQDMDEEGADLTSTGQASGATEAYINVFLFKYVCPNEHCSGTLAPVLGSDISICNMCGFIRTDAEFAREMEQYS